MRTFDVQNQGRSGPLCLYARVYFRLSNFRMHFYTFFWENRRLILNIFGGGEEVDNVVRSFSTFLAKCMERFGRTILFYFGPFILRFSFFVDKFRILIFSSIVVSSDVKFFKIKIGYFEGQRPTRAIARTSQCILKWPTECVRIFVVYELPLTIFMLYSSCPREW